MKEAQVKFIQANIDADLHRLLLSARQYPDIDMPLAVAQIAAMRKVRDKIPSWQDSRLQFPPALSLEQASSEQTARFKATLFAGTRMADLTGGMGVDSFFWANRFEQVHYVEQQAGLSALAQQNFDILGAHNIQVHAESAEDFIGTTPHSFDLVYLDPARRGDQQQKVFMLADCQPNIVALKAELFKKTGRILIKTAPMLDLKEAVRQLEQVQTIWVISVANEVKEVLYLLTPTAGQTPDIHAVRLESSGTARTFSFTWAEEMAEVAPLGMPATYLYEPDAAILKSGAFKTFATRYGCTKLHTHTHLYTSDEWIPSIPGRGFRIEHVCKYDRKAVQAYMKETKANIASRNFPESVAQIRKKLSLTEGGDRYLFAVTLCDQAKVVLVCGKVG